MRTLEEVDVLALPSALVRELEVDISALATFDDVIRVKDLTAPAGIEILTEVETAVASVQPPRTQEEMDALDEAVVEDVDAVEVEGETKEGEEEAEGEADGEKKEKEEEEKKPEAKDGE
jgi:large subunit ribosomal protein L25